MMLNVGENRKNLADSLELLKQHKYQLINSLKRRDKNNSKSPKNNFYKQFSLF